MKNIVLFCFFISLSSFGLFGQNNLLEGLQEKFSKITDFKASFEQSTSMINSKKETKLKGNFFFKKGNKYIIEINQQKIICDGSTLWNYNDKLKRTVINKSDDEVSTFSLEKIIFEYPPKCDIKESFEVRTITLSPKNEELGFELAVIKLNTEGMIQEIIITDFNDTIFKVSLTNTAFNNKYEDSFFNFNPPSGSKIVDLR